MGENDICDEDCTLKLSSVASTRNSITLTWNAVNDLKHKPTYKVQLKDRLWGWITKYWGFRTEVEIKQLAPQECYNFRIGMVKPNSNSELDITWSSTIRAVTKDEHISALSLHRAILYGNMSLAKKFLSLRSSTIDCYDSNGKTALMKCARLGDTKLMSLLLSAGASINMQSISSCSTALMIACWFGHLSIAGLLHENNANWSIKDSYGCTALHYAVDNSQKELINFAVECGANIEARDNNGWTPLLRGVYLGSETSALSELVHKGACVNVCDVRGQTPLMQAVITSNGDSISVIKLLLSAGAEIKVINKYNNTALLMANARQDYAIVEELITSLQNGKDD